MNQIDWTHTGENIAGALFDGTAAVYLKEPPFSQRDRRVWITSTGHEYSKDDFIFVIRPKKEIDRLFWTKKMLGAYYSRKSGKIMFVEGLNKVKPNIPPTWGYRKNPLLDIQEEKRDVVGDGITDDTDAIKGGESAYKIRAADLITLEELDEILDNSVLKVEKPKIVKLKKEPNDVGKHYRYSYTRKLTEKEIETGEATFKLDPYRIASLYNLGGGPREHIVKKGLRGTDKGHTELELVNELQCCLDRWREMLEEDDERGSISDGG